MIMPPSTPSSPPMLVSTAASVRNWNRILRFLAPIAFFQADLACTFRYRYQHNIHNTDTADQKRNARDPDQLLVRALA